MEKHQLIRAIQAEIGHATGRRYQIDLNVLDMQSLLDLLRLLRDLDTEKQLAKNRSRLMPWRR
jgi:hypothetical protein